MPPNEVPRPHPEKIFPVSWDQFHRDSRALAWRLAGGRAFEAIVCITRGGLVPAAIVARELGVPVGVPDDEAGVGLLDGPGRREAAGGHRVRAIIAFCRLRRRLLCVGLREYHLGSVDIRFGRYRREHNVD